MYKRQAVTGHHGYAAGHGLDRHPPELLVPPGDAASLGAALEALGADPRRWQSARDAGLARAAQATWASIARQYQRLYDVAAHVDPPGERGVEIIVVAYGTPQLLARALASAAGHVVTVVDNSSSAAVEQVCRVAGVRYLDPGANLGFGAGVNHALADRLVPGADVLLLNPDTETIGDAIPQLVRYLEAHPDVAVVGPRLLYPDGSLQPSRRRFPTRGVYFWESTPLAQRWPGNPWARRYRYTDVPDDQEQDVGWLVGAALLVRRETITRAGLLDAGFHMYSEELEWQRRIARGPGAHRIVYLPTATIIHHEGKSSEQAPARRYLNFQRSRIRDAAMVYGPRFAALLAWFLRAAYAAELAVEAAKWVIGHKRQLRAERIGVYWQVVRGL